MVPDVAGKGHSFKGAFAYYAHDKGAATAERVAWMDFRNLVVDDLATAQRVMTATAYQADQLKKAAGVKNTGRKSNAHVYAFSLAWHPDEAGSLDRAEMVRAVDASLKAIEADHLQAVIICHTDQKHPHVHVILNRVDPATGRMFAASKDHDKLSAWAAAYERERGLIVTPARQQKQQAREQAREQKPAADPQPRAAADPRTQPSGGEIQRKTQGQKLAEAAAEQKLRHAKEWRDLSERNKARRDAIFAAAKAEMKAAIDKAKEENRPLWREHFRQQETDKRQFFSRENRILGIVRNAIEVVRMHGKHGSGFDTGFLTMAFNYIGNGPARKKAFIDRQAEDREAMEQSAKRRVDAAAGSVRTARDATLAAARDDFTKQRAALIERQNAEKAQTREAWKRFYADKEKLAAHADRSRKRMRSRNDQNLDQVRRMDRHHQAKPAPQKSPPPSPERQPVKTPFDRAAAPEQPKAPPAAQTETRRVSVPDSAPSPMGEVPRRPKETVEVPTPAPAEKPAGRRPYFAQKEAAQNVTPEARPEPKQQERKPYFAQKEPERKADPAKTPEKAQEGPLQPHWTQVAAKKPEATQQPEKPGLRDYWKEGVKPSDRPKPGPDRGPERER